MKTRVTKESGATEDFDPGKLSASLVRSGASPEMADDIAARVMREIGPSAKTRHIYKLAKKYLRRMNHASGLRYSLKRAVMRLGPTGYPFERYVGDLLTQYGYEVEVGVILDGRCVKHEVDVVAWGNGEVSVVECKYHNATGKATDVKVAMYVHSRVEDLRPLMTSRHPGKTYRGSLVTNTRCTADARDYARCMDMKIVSWGYPPDSSLQKMIEDKRLYPVTILSGVQRELIRKLFDHNIILLKDLIDVKSLALQSMLSIPENRAVSMRKQAEALCLC